MTTAIADVAEAIARQNGIEDDLERDTHELVMCRTCGEVYVMGMMATREQCIPCAQDGFDSSFQIIERRCD